LGDYDVEIAMDEKGESGFNAEGAAMEVHKDGKFVRRIVVVFGKENAS